MTRPTRTLGDAPVVYLPCGLKEFVGWARRVYDRCQWCGGKFDQKVNRGRAPTRDHLTPVSRGGGNDLTNLALACYQCNHVRGSRIASPTMPFFGPKWKTAPGVLVGKAEADAENACALWGSERPRLWRMLVTGPWNFCHKYRKQLQVRRDSRGVRRRFMILPRAAAVKPQYVESPPRVDAVVVRPSPWREQVAVRAYYMWEHAGRPQGCGEEFWLAAEQELLRDLRTKGCARWL